MAQAGSRIGNLIDKNASTYYSSTESAEEAPEPILEDVALSYDNQSSLPASESGDRNMEVTDEKSVKGVSPYSFAEIPVGFLLCWCKPTRVTNAKDFFQRTSNWTALNKGEFLSSLTGTSKKNYRLVGIFSNYCFSIQFLHSFSGVCTGT